MLQPMLDSDQAAPFYSPFLWDPKSAYFSKWKFDQNPFALMISHLSHRLQLAITSKMAIRTPNLDQPAPFCIPFLFDPFSVYFNSTWGGQYGGMRWSQTELGYSSCSERADLDEYDRIGAWDIIAPTVARFWQISQNSENQFLLIWLTLPWS